MSEIYLKIKGVDGDVTDEKYVKHIHVLSLSLGGINPSSTKVGVQAGSAAGGGKVIMEDVSFMKVCDRSTPSLTTNFFAGKHFEEFEFKYVVSRGTTSDTFKTIKLTDVLITGFHHSGESGGGREAAAKGDLPLEKIAVNFAKIEIGYRPRKTEGGFDDPLKSGYNVALARPA